MHDRKRKPDICKMCSREDQEAAQRQEATIMAKQTVECATCGGSYDGTPSGQAKHEATSKHFQAANPAETPAPETAETSAGRSPLQRELTASLSGLIQSKEQELARRQVDLKWRVVNRPDQAGVYEDDKVTPLKVEIQLLRDARKFVDAQ